MFMAMFREFFSRVFFAKKMFGLVLILSLILPSYLVVFTEGGSKWVIQTVDSGPYAGKYRPSRWIRGVILILVIRVVQMI
jgi:hypothetical protein